MSSVVFNSFKQRYLNGEVPHDDEWKFIPVNKSFTKNFGQDEFPLEQYRSISDFYDHDYSAMDNSYFEGIKRDIFWYKPADTDSIHKPMYITSGSLGEKGKYDKRSNWEDFQETIYMKDISGNSAIPGYLASGGFYYIRTKDELRWFAARANTGNNRIIGVLGDGIDGVIRGQIGSDENYPFQGVFDGNGHTLGDVAVVCDSVDNGLIGVLGQDGVVKNIKLKNTQSGINLLCEKRIDLNHIKTDGRDINAGLLVGRNYGRIENIDGSELQTFKFSGFVPQVYSVTNKSDDYKDFYTTIRPKYDNGENFYFLNSWCINSPGNICPYVGYFAEGLFAQSARGFDANGGICAIECSPALKSKYDAGLCDVSLKLESKCSKIAFFVKPFSPTSPDWTTPEEFRDIWHCQSCDARWGTNCVMFVGFETEDETGKKVTYVLEMNGTAYDKKSGTGKRRYHFHCGHYDFRQHLKTAAYGDAWDDAEDIGDDDEIRDGWKNYYVLFKNGPESDWVWVPWFKEYNNGEDDSNEEQAIADDEYVIGDDDIRVYTSDGIPAKINNKDIQSLYFAPRNFDTSNAMWPTTTYTGNVKAGVQVPFTVTLAGETAATNFYMKLTADQPILQFFTDEEDVDDDDEDAPAPIDVAYTNFFYADGEHAGENISEETFDANEDILIQAARNTLANAVSDETYTAWTIHADEPHHDYGGEIVVDDQDEWFFEQYFTNRCKYERTWEKGYTYQYLNDYDIGINNQDGIRSEGTLDVTLLTVGRFQYRPFVHASDDDTAIAAWGDKRVPINPGTKLYLVSAYFKQQGYADEDAVNHALAYVAENAKLYIDNPNYYGMDRNGLWTTNCVRPDPEDQNWSRGLTANRESWLSTLNFNWNIMQKMFDTEKQYYKEMSQYASLDDGDDPALTYSDLDFADEWYRDSDLPHAILNKPIRMHNMARAAYYISPIAGANYGRIKNVIVSSDRENVGNFVGFVGSLAGKQERGVVESAHVYARDQFTYWAGLPEEPTHDGRTDEEFERDHTAWETARSAYNFQVRYKQTPIMPSAVSEAVQTLGENPDDNWTEWQYYPSEASEVISEDYIHEIVKGHSSLSAYLQEQGVTMYGETAGTYVYSAGPGEVYTSDYVMECYKENPNYVFEKRFYDASLPIRQFTSAWYDDYESTATQPYDDVITYNLRPIFNAGGLFGKIVPTYNENKIELSGSASRGTQLHHIDVHYILNDPLPYAGVTGADLAQYYTKDIHDTFGAIAGLVEVQTSELGQWNYADKNSVNMGNINVSGEGNAMPNKPVTPFGFISYQPTELNTVQATKSSPRQKNGDWCGEYTETTWALDAPVVINNKMWWSKNYYCFAPINQSSAAFFMMSKSLSAIRPTHTDKMNYFSEMTNKLLLPYGNSTDNSVNINTNELSYCNADAFDFYQNYRGPMSIQASFGSQVTFEPAIGFNNPATGNQEMLKYERCGATRTYSMTRDTLRASDLFNHVTEFSPVNVDCLCDGEIFNNKERFDDKYFEYTYSSTTSFVDDWTFKHNVIFTSALKDADAGKPVTMNEKATLGYVFRDPMAYSADGFWYNYNYLHIGNSVSPAYIRENIKKPGAVLHTSACSGAYYDENNELVSAKGDHDFGGVLVVDGQDRTVMFIDNTDGSKIDGGSWNMACEPVTYQGHRGGLLLEVK